MDEIGKGLADAGVLQMLQKYPHFLRSLFVYEEGVLTAGIYIARSILLLQDYNFCVPTCRKDDHSARDGSSQLVKEKTTYINFCDLLEELEGIYS